MDTYEDLLKREEEREIAEWRFRKEAQDRYESAAMQAHKIRMAGRLLISPVPPWEEISLTSRRHLVADAENVAKNPSISYEELNKLYKERLIASGDIDNPDLDAPDEASRVIEEQVLVALKAFLSTPQPVASGAASPSMSEV